MTAALYMIEGETLTIAKIAERLGLLKQAAYLRLRRLQAKQGTITWQALRGHPATSGVRAR